MEIKETEIEGVYILKPDIYGDSRGYFFIFCSVLQSATIQLIVQIFKKSLA